MWGQGIKTLFGSLIAGIVCVIVLKIITKYPKKENLKRGENARHENKCDNTIITTPSQVGPSWSEERLVNAQNDVASSISNRHIEAGRTMKENLISIDSIDEKMEDIIDAMEESRQNMRKKLNGLS